MKASADRVGFHADADQVVGLEHLEGLLFGQGHSYPTVNNILAGKSGRMRAFHASRCRTRVFALASWWMPRLLPVLVLVHAIESAEDGESDQKY